MGRNEIYRTFLLQKRNDWKWWDTWLDSYVNRRSYYNSSSSSNESSDKKFLESYLQMLAQNNIEPIRNTFQEDPRHYHNHQYPSNIYEGSYDPDHHRSTYFGNGHHLSSHPEDQEPGQMNNFHEDESDEEMQLRQVQGVQNNNNVGGMPALPGPEVSGFVAENEDVHLPESVHPAGHHDIGHEAVPPAAHGYEPAGAPGGDGPNGTHTHSEVGHDGSATTTDSHT